MDTGVQPPVRRLDPTVLAAIALGVILLLIVGAVVLGSRDDRSDRLGDNAVTAAREDPERRCSSQATYDLIKRDLFRRAAEVRGSDQAAFNRLGAYAVLRVEAPMLREENEEIGSVTCAATVSLDLPPGVAVVGGRRTLTAEILYTVQAAADGSGSVVTLANAEEIVTPLATLARTGSAEGDALDAGQADGLGNAVAEPPAPSDPLSPLPPSPPAEPAPPSGPAASPSFNCANARTRGEIAVCESPGLAALDRAMAAQFNAALSRASAAQRALLIRTRDLFLQYRDNCPSDACIAQTYRGRMREIADIMAGRWSPQR